MLKKRYSITLKGYVARDEDGRLFFYPHVKPKRFDGFWMGGVIPDSYYSCPPDYPCVDITWEDEPREAIMTMHLYIVPK